MNNLALSLKFVPSSDIDERKYLYVVQFDVQFLLDGFYVGVAYNIMLSNIYAKSNAELTVEFLNEIDNAVDELEWILPILKHGGYQFDVTLLTHEILESRYIGSNFESEPRKELARLVDKVEGAEGLKLHNLLAKISREK